MLRPVASLSPRVRQVLAALALVSGVLLVGRTLRGRVQRDTELRLPLDGYARLGHAPRAVRLTLTRGGEPLRVVTVPVEPPAPETLAVPLKAPEGVVTVRVEVTLEDRVAVSEQTVTLEAGGSARLEPPPAP
ncbi:MAG: hypothetical protein HY909_00160 [Deltaproteobacteria bacterium]|nr:hypothetical protein [Deltaproteobacteria bacterium]